MPNLKDRFNKLKTTVLGVKTSDIDTKLDSASKAILAYKSQSGRAGYIDLVRSLVAKTGNFKFDASQNSFLGGAGMSPATMGQGGRLHRYKTYETIVDYINYCHRALTVLVDNILSPDDISKISLEIKPESFLEDEVPTESKQNIIKEIIKKIKLEDSLELIARSTLLFGDFFCEIADAKTALTSKSLLAEQFQFGSDSETINIKEGKESAIFNLDFSSFTEAEVKKKSTKKDQDKILDNLHIIYHDPKFVVKLQSDLFPVCFGYLIFPRVSLNPHLSMQDDMINSICQKILKSVANKVPQVKGFTNDKDLKEIIAAMVSETAEGKAVNIRYVPPNKIQHFKRPTTKYEPYGESIFDSTQFTAKILIALETALAIQRLARSTEKRKIGVEIGLPRDARNAIEAMKEAFRKRKVSLDSFDSIDTIPSMITTFEDIYIPMKDGKHFVEVDTFTEGNVDVRGKVDELKMMRDQLVASLGVPASFLAIEENLSNKCLDLLTKIPLLSGKVITLQELIDEFNNIGTIENKYSYSYDIETGKIVPGKIVWAGITRKDAQVVRVTLDNGKSEIVTPDHHFMLRDGTYIEAQYLKEGDSLMPLYSKLTHIKTSKRIPYEIIYHPGIEEWEETHRMVAKHEDYIKDGDLLNVHHIDFNPMNNCPTNLEGLTNKDHAKIHIEHKQFITTGRGNVNLDNYEEGICIICGENYTKHIKANQVTCLKNECKKERARRDGIKSGLKRNKKIFFQCPFCGELFTRTNNYSKNIKSTFMTCGSKECYRQSFILYSNNENQKRKLSEYGKKGGNKSKDKLVTYNKKHGAPMKGRTIKTNPEIFERRNETLKRKKLNHKVVKIELLEYTIDTGDITVEKYHNFAVNSGIIVSNSALSEENILFARTIVSHQKYLTHDINELIEKIVEIINPEEALTLFDNVVISLPSPKSLQYEREARYMSELANLVETLERIGIPKEYSKKKYLSQIDWQEVEKYKIDDALDKELGTTKDDDEGGLGGMGGMSGMGGI